MTTTSGNFKRFVMPGLIPGDGTPGVKWVRLFVTIEYKDGRLSITGVEGPLSSGDCRGSCGQTGIRADITPNDKEGWTTETVDRLRQIWDRWHLNDMRPGCEHQQGPEWDASRPVELQELSWRPEFTKARDAAVAGRLTPIEYETFANREIFGQAVRAQVVYRLTTAIVKPRHPDLWGPEGDTLLAAGYLKLGKTETKTAGWVYPTEHPDGLLCKPCPVCGHRYGTEWKKEEVPGEVVEWLRGLKDTEESCPAVWAR